MATDASNSTGTTGITPPPLAGTPGNITTGTPPVPGYNGPPQYTPTQTGYGVAPADLTSQFPGVATVGYNPINAAPYSFTNPIQYAQKNAGAIQGLYQSNLGLSNTDAFSELNTELAGLEGYAPAVSQLQTGIASAQNQFNQNLRLGQVQSTIPGASNALQSQLGQAQSYAAGTVPSSISDSALELGIRSSAADQAFEGGFGAQSGAAQKAATLESAAQRVQLSQYGNSLLNQNVSQQEALYLSPTNYVNSASQISVMPSLSGSQLSLAGQNTLNSLNQVPTTSALASTTQQNQFTTGLQQQTSEFNAANTLSAGEFNAQNENNFGLQKFGYQVAQAGAQAGAEQTDINTQVGLQQQQQYEQIMEQYMSQAQNSQLLGSLFQGGSALLGSGGASSLFSGASNLIQGIGTGASSYFSPSGPGAPGTGLGPVQNSSGTGGSIYSAALGTNSALSSIGSALTSAVGK